MDVTEFETQAKAAREAMQARRLTEAETAFQALVSSAPHRPPGHIGLAEVAQARGDWPTALALWDALLTRFPRHGNRPAWERSKALALAHLGRGEDAEALVRPQTEAIPNDPRPWVALAQIAMRVQRWDVALAHWEQALATFPADAALHWELGRAEALFRLERHDEAEAAYGAIARANPAHVHAAQRYLQLLARSDPPEAAMAEIRYGMFKDRTEYPLVRTMAHIALRLEDMPFARSLLPRIVAEAASGHDVQAAFHMLSVALEGRALTDARRALEERAETLLASGHVADRARLHLTLMQLKLALRDPAAMLAMWDAAPPDLDPVWANRFARLVPRLRAPRFPNFEEEKVFGIGFSKTGTTSLAAALEHLGYLTAHYVNDFTHEILTIEDAFFFDALTDSPMCAYVETFFHTFPNSKFIYTTRPVEDWEGSLSAHLRRYSGTSDFARLRDRTLTPGRIRFGSAQALPWVPTFYSHPDARAAREAFETRIRRFFTGERAARLLVFDMFSGDGWAKLCAFLGRPVPPVPFPWENKAPTR